MRNRRTKKYLPCVLISNPGVSLTVVKEAQRKKQEIGHILTKIILLVVIIAFVAFPGVLVAQDTTTVIVDTTQIVQYPKLTHQYINGETRGRVSYEALKKELFLEPVMDNQFEKVDLHVLKGMVFIVMLILWTETQ